jgi:hypothetical protein
MFEGRYGSWWGGDWSLRNGRERRGGEETEGRESGGEGEVGNRRKCRDSVGRLLNLWYGIGSIVLGWEFRQGFKAILE